MSSGRIPHRGSIVGIASMLGLLFSLCQPVAGLAQLGTPGGDEGPIRIQADSGIEWQQNQRVYIARGNALAARGNSEVRADTLIAYYRERAGGAPQPKPEANAGLAGGLSGEGGSTEIFRVEAIGNVILKHEASTVTGERAVYDIDQGIAVVTGNNLKLTTATDVVTARDSLEWFDGKQIAVARGNAVATRSGKTIKADILTAYMHKSPQPTTGQPPASGPARAGPAAGSASPRPAQGGTASAPEGASRLSRVDAQGQVVISDTLNTGRGDYGVYNGDTGIATLIGNVVIQRGANVIQGQRAVMDLNKNIARLLPGGGPGEGNQRVQGLFVRDQTTQGTGPAGERRQP